MTANWFRSLLQRLSSSKPRTRRAPERRALPPRLELLEDRLAPAGNLTTGGFTVVHSNAAAADIRTVIFFESSVANWQTLSQGLPAGTEAVLLNAGGNGLSEMAAFLNGRHGLSTIDIVAHGSDGQIDLATATLTAANLGSYTGQLTAIGGALAGGEIDLWSCDTAAGSGGATLVHELSAATGAAVAAADHLVGATSLGGSWQLDVRTAGAQAAVPFDADARAAFDEVLGAGPALLL